MTNNKEIINPYGENGSPYSPSSELHPQNAKKQTVKPEKELKDKKEKITVENQEIQTIKEDK